jgi:tetratricopeptide (TPR) repeat protein
MVQKAEAYVREGSYASAEKLYIETISLDPKSIIAYKGLGELYAFQKEYDQAVEVFDFIIKCLNQPDADVYAMLGKIHKFQGKVLEAEQDLKKLINLDKERAEAYIDLAIIEKALGKYDLVVEHAGKALLLIPNHPRYLDLILECTIILGKKMEAISYFEKLKEVNPENQKLEDFSKRIKEM